jgi:hypothetical protein
MELRQWLITRLGHDKTAIDVLQVCPVKPCPEFNFDHYVAYLRFESQELASNAFTLLRKTGKIRGAKVLKVFVCNFLKFKVTKFAVI